VPWLASLFEASHVRPSLGPIGIIKAGSTWFAAKTRQTTAPIANACVVSATDKSFLCRIETLEGEALAARAVSVVFPALDGQVGVLPRCGPVAAALGAGPLYVQKAGGQRLEYFVVGGFARIRDDLVTILAQECLPADRLDAADARSQLERALAMPAQPAAAAEAKDWAVRVARARLRAAERAPG
jgi:F-type H+-transporting ATPase subunit epsilon